MSLHARQIVKEDPEFSIDQANAVMGVFNKYDQKIRKLKIEVEGLRMKDDWAHPMYERLVEVSTMMTEMLEEYEELLLL